MSNLAIKTNFFQHLYEEEEKLRVKQVQQDNAEKENAEKENAEKEENKQPEEGNANNNQQLRLERKIV